MTYLVHMCVFEVVASHTYLITWILSTREGIIDGSHHLIKEFISAEYV